jgi:hypothetical protein
LQDPRQLKFPQIPVHLVLSQELKEIGKVNLTNRVEEKEEAVKSKEKVKNLHLIYKDLVQLLTDVKDNSTEKSDKPKDFL